jgi:hypothetical protein
MDKDKALQTTKRFYKNSIHFAKRLGAGNIFFFGSVTLAIAI